MMNNEGPTIKTSASWCVCKAGSLRRKCRKSSPSLKQRPKARSLDPLMNLRSLITRSTRDLMARYWLQKSIKTPILNAQLQSNPSCLPANLMCRISAFHPRRTHVHPKQHALRGRLQSLGLTELITDKNCKDLLKLLIRRSHTSAPITARGHSACPQSRAFQVASQSGIKR
jgi:hypothetical protein